MTISVVKAATNFASFSATVTASIATGSGSYRKARAWLGCSADTVPVPSTVTIGADSLTIVGAQQTGPGTGGMKWRLFESTSDLTVTGTQTATGTVDAVPGSGASILLVEIYQSTVGSITFGTPVFSNPESGSAGSISSNVTASASEKAVMLLRESSGSTISATSPGTLNTDLGTTFAASVIRDGAGGTTAVGVSFSGSYGVIAAAYSISEPAGAPVLTSPTGAATANTTANAGATIDAVSGSGSRIMYALPRIGGSAASAATIISTGTQLAITSAGAKSVPLTGLTNGASYSADVVYVDATTGTSNVVTSSWTQTAAPVLSSPTNTPGSTTALIGATTDVTSGTAYFLPRVGGSAASAATIISTGQTSTVTTTTASRTVTGLTASTANNYVDIVQVSGVTTSNVVSTAAFTTTAAGDETVPTLGGSIIIGTVTSSSIQTSLSQAGADNVGVTSYEVSSNSGGSWLDIGIPGSLVYTFSGLSASTSYPLWWRAKDAAGNVSTALTATQSTAAASGVGSINLNNAIYTFKTNNGTPLASLPVTFYVSDVSTGALVGSAITGLSTNASAIVTTAISNASMLAGTTYTLRWKFSGGEIGIAELPAI